MHPWSNQIIINALEIVKENVYIILLVKKLTKLATSWVCSEFSQTDTWFFIMANKYIRIWNLCFKNYFDKPKILLPFSAQNFFYLHWSVFGLHKIKTWSSCGI